MLQQTGHKILTYRAWRRSRRASQNRKCNAVALFSSVTGPSANATFMKTTLTTPPDTRRDRNFTASSAQDSRVGYGAGRVVRAGQSGDELVQLPQSRADGLALAEVLHQEEDAEKQVEKRHLPEGQASEQQHQERQTDRDGKTHKAVHIKATPSPA